LNYGYLAPVAIILNIDSAIQTASVCLAENGQALGLKTNPLQKESAAWIHTAIRELLVAKDTSLQQLNAVCVSAGPGSYTGLRVGMAAAKGLCFALHIPLILVNTLKMMAVAAQAETADLLCPMIDARRMEVFTALYDHELREIMPAANLILDKDSFEKELDRHSICFFGNGSAKFRELTGHGNAFFRDIAITALHLVPLSNQLFINKEFADLAYAEPNYGKEFHSTVKQSL
jgi:tRNA threonylcarbamoyladenosine biosynthesis protein TsaB